MTITASAPGKLIVIGEYAVLDGAPAIVAAVDRRASASITPAADGGITVDATDLDIRAGATVRATPTGPTVSWDADPPTAARLNLVTAAFEAAARRATAQDTDLPPAHIVLTTTAFFDRRGHKLGLGSSAALTVALTAALHRAAGLPDPALPDLVTQHRALQDGRGSGADIGASLTGGVIVYRGGDTDHPTATPTRLPPDIAWCAVAAGHSTSTAGYLQRVAAWRAQAPTVYDRYHSDLTAAANEAVRAVTAQDADGLLTAVTSYSAVLDALGQSSGTDIVSDAHRELRNLALRCGVHYKPSGAGGGDVGIGMACDEDRIRAFTAMAEDGGYRGIALGIDRQGLEVTDSG